MKMATIETTVRLINVTESLDQVAEKIKNGFKFIGFTERKFIGEDIEESEVIINSNQIVDFFA